MRAIYEWCTDNGFTPYLSVKVYGAAKVPMEFVRNGEIVLNISFGATSGLKMDNNGVAFNARFGGVSREIYVPIENVQAVYASENGQGMAFEIDVEELSDKKEVPLTAPTKPALGLAAVSNVEPDGTTTATKPGAEVQKKFEKPTLKIIK
jgi:stringent starvation protein B